MCVCKSTRPKESREAELEDLLARKKRLLDELSAMTEELLELKSKKLKFSEGTPKPAPLPTRGKPASAAHPGAPPAPAASLPTQGKPASAAPPGAPPAPAPSQAAAPRPAKAIPTRKSSTPAVPVPSIPPTQVKEDPTPARPKPSVRRALQFTPVSSPSAPSPATESQKEVRPRPVAAPVRNIYGQSYPQEAEDSDEEEDYGDEETQSEHEECKYGQIVDEKTGKVLDLLLALTF